MAGAGAFSDGKYVISTEYGGWLTDFLKPETVIDYIEQADSDSGLVWRDDRAIFAGQ